MTGQLDWTLPDIIALEDAAGRYPVTRLLARRLDADVSDADGSLIEHGSRIAKESGEAIAAILAAQQSSSANQRADAVVQVDEAIEAMQSVRALLEGDAHDLF